MKSSVGKSEVILAAAATLFLKHGLRGTSMEAIAREAGIAKPTLYAYFPDKQAVFLALTDQLISAWRHEFLTALSGEGDIVQRVGAALIAKHKAVMRLLANSPHADELYGEHDRLAAAQFRGLDAEMAVALETELTRAAIPRPRLMTQLLLAASYGIGHKAQSMAELGPALRLLTERLVGPDVPR